MSNGSAAIPLLKAAPDAAQVAERLDGGSWRGLELCLAAEHVRDDGALREAIDVSRGGLGENGLTVTAEAPVSWPSGAFVRVDRLDDEARAGIERSAEFAAAVGSPVLTIHLFVPVDAAEFREAGPLDEERIEEFLRFYADACLQREVTPLIENVPPILRMRVGGVFLSRIGGHWHDLLEWRQRVPELGFTLDTSHAALFRSFAAAYPSPFGLASDQSLELERYVEELGPAAEVAHVSDASGLLGEGLEYGSGELELDPIVRRLAQLVPYIVAEINEPDHSRSPGMKAGYQAIESALAAKAEPAPSRPARVPADDFDWQQVAGQRDPVPSVIELEELVAGRRLLISGAGGSIGHALTSLLLGFRPERITVIDAHEGSLAADRRSRDPALLESLDYALCDIREPDLLGKRFAEARPELVFHLAAYKHVDLAERFPEEFVDTNLHGTWNLLRAAESVDAARVVVASTDKAALGASFYGRTKRFLEQLTALAAAQHGSRIAMRLVNVLGSAGSASELFLRQARADVPLTVTDTGMVRYWITMAHATTLLAHAALMAEDGSVLAGPTGMPEMTVGEVAERIWRCAGRDGSPALAEIGIRAGETMSEVLTGPGETVGAEAHQGVAAIDGDGNTGAAEWVSERIPEGATREQARPIWLEAMELPGLARG